MVDKLNTVQTIKVLGFLIHKRGSMDSQVSKTVGECHGKLNLAEKYKKYLSPVMRTRFIHSIIISRLNYILPFVSGETEVCKSMITKLLNRSARFIRNDYCFMERLSSIYKSVKLKPPGDMINESSAKFIQKVVYHEKSEQTY